MIQRHMKTWKYSSFIHGFLGISSLCLIHYSAYTIYKDYQFPSSYFSVKTMRYVRTRLTICALITDQVVLGIITKYLIRYKRSLVLLLFARRVHHALDWTIVVLGLVTLRWATIEENKIF